VSSKSISENKSKKKAKDCCCGNVPLLYLCLNLRCLPSHTQSVCSTRLHTPSEVLW
jgi:hypothetical protein